MVQIRPPKNRTTAAKGIRANHYVNRLPEEAQGQQMGVDAADSTEAGGLLPERQKKRKRRMVHGTGDERGAAAQAAHAARGL